MGAHHSAGKDIYYEESMKVPMIISWPQQIKPRVDNHTMIAFGDMYPTLLSMMGFSKDIPQEVQTFDFANSILSGKADKKTVQPYYRVQPDNPTTGYRGLRTSRYTFAVHATNGKIDRTVQATQRMADADQRSVRCLSPEETIKKRFVTVRNRQFSIII